MKFSHCFSMCVVLMLVLSFSPATITAQESSRSIAVRLAADGFENVRVARSGHFLEIALEDNHYHGEYHGLAVALELLAMTLSSDDQVMLTALEDGVPKVTVRASLVHDKWTVNVSHGGHVSSALKAVKPISRSYGKVDIVPYPSLALSNYKLDKPWSTAFYITPTLELTPWKGAHIAAGVRLLVADNVEGDLKQVMPGYMTLTQRLVSTKYIDFTMAGGIFNLNRAGLDARLTYHATSCLDFGLIAAYTGYWYVDNIDNWQFYTLRRFNVLGKIDYYEPYTNLQFTVMGGRFVSGDGGVHGEVLRHLRDYTVGIYGSYSSYGSNIGVQCSYPLGPKKQGKHRPIRLRLPETMSFSFAENLDGQKQDNSSRLDPIYHTRPGENHSSQYWQPEFIRDCILMYLEKDVK